MTIAARMLKTLRGGGQGGPSLDAMLAGFDSELKNFQSLVRPSPESKPRTPFDSPNIPPDKSSVANMTPRQVFSVLPVMAPLMLQMRKSAKLYDGSFQPTRSEADPEFIVRLEQLAHEMGAKHVKYVKVPNNAIFLDKGIPHSYAVLFTVEMDRDNLAGAPSFDAFKEVAIGYKNLAVIGNRLAAFMRQNGFAAYPGTALGGLTDYVYLAVLAGLGAIGYHGLLITPDEGARLRINTIYTNITNLPIETANEHLWVRDFCAMCRKCVRECPVDAIFDQPQPRGDGGMQCIDHGACRDYFNQNFGCAVCLIACPFSKAGYDKVYAHFKGNPNAPQFRIALTPISVEMGARRQ
ncbi:MAG: reductive dehalogenase domain-containing protein [Caldilineales bacterium]